MNHFACLVDALRPSLPDPEALLPPILAALDNTSASYDITRRTTA